MQMVKVALALGGMASCLAVGIGVASAAPDLGPLINTTCGYSQIVAAINAQSPDAANELNAQPIAQSMLNDFIASPADQRQQIAQQVIAMPVGQQYAVDFWKVASTCSNF
jgi:hemophore-related protein